MVHATYSPPLTCQIPCVGGGTFNIPMDITKLHAVTKIVGQVYGTELTHILNYNMFNQVA